VRVTRRDDERGATAIIIAIVAVVLFSMAAFALDTGNLWQTRRSMVTASDAGALGAASKYAVGGDGCAAGGAPALVADNRTDATLDVCQPTTIDAHNGYVTVKAHTNVDFTFAGLFGTSNRSVASTTTAQWGMPKSAIGLRPIALCLTSTPALKQWLNLPAGPSGPTSSPVTVTLSNAQPDACKDSSGSVAGNWGLAFGSGNNANSDTVGWTLNGYPDPVDVGSDIHANPGAFSGSLQSALNTLQDGHVWFPLPVFDRVDGNNGNNAEYHVVAFVFVQLVDFTVTGNQASRFITVNLAPGVIQGTCCGTGPDTGTRVVRICDVDTLAPDTSQGAC
jgi:Putative Flp pilus-assembly TadE/G-like